MDIDSYYKSQLIRYAWFHCNHKDALNGLKAHLFVLCNRFDSGFGSWQSILDTADHYAGNPKITNPAPNSNDALWMKLLAAIDSIYDGTEPSTATATTIDGKVIPALYIVDLTEPITDWFRLNILQQREDHHQINVCGRLTLFS